MTHPTKQADMEALARWQNRLRAEPELRYLFFELTDSCNLHCLHCGSRCSARRHTMLPPYAVQKVLQSVCRRYDPGDIMVCITGGEPTLHPNLPDIIRIAHNMGFPVGMTTNATLINRDTAEKMVLSGLDTVAVSLDGLCGEHEAFRRVKGCWEEAVSGIRALQEAGLSPQVLTVVHRQNISKLDELYALLCELGIESWRIVNIDPIGRAALNRQLLLTPAEMKKLLVYIREKRFDPQNRMEVTYGCSHFVTLAFEREVRDFYFQCGAGLCVAGIRANGDITACLDIAPRPELVQGNIARDDFASVWENKFQAFRTDRTQNSPVCRECEHRGICMGDSMHTWNFERNCPDYCLAQMWKTI